MTCVIGKNFFNLFQVLFFSLLIICFSPTLKANNDSTDSKFSFSGDFRFRAEQDWNFRQSDGSYKANRSRLRYRFRAGLYYQPNDWASVGARIRTGNPYNQQDPQLTLGDGFNEFGTLPIALEQAYFKGEHEGFSYWLGKNTFPFEKQNELFWSDNVFPEGVFLGKRFNLKSNFLNEIDLRAGHFIINARGSSFDSDSYFQGFQIRSEMVKNKLVLFPSLYLFRNIQNLPDGGETFLFNYSIAHLGARLVILQEPFIGVETDLYFNLENYSKNDSIPGSLKDQKNGFSASLVLGEKEKMGDLFFKLTYTYQERYAAIDFFVQNDWARWDYSSIGSPAGRLTNLQGIELVGTYMLKKNIALTVKYYQVNQLVLYGPAQETGNRIRFDIDVKF